MRTILQNYSKTLLWVFGLLFYATVFAQTPFTATYTFTGATGNVQNFVYNGTSYQELSFGDISKVGVTSSASNNNFRANNWPTGATSGSDSFTGSIDLEKYIEFSIATVPGYKYTITAISFGIGRSATGTRQLEWRSSIGNFANAIDGYTTFNQSLTINNGVLTNPDTTPASGFTGNILTLPSQSYANLTTDTSFRLYFYNAESNVGTAGLQGPITITGTYELLETPLALDATIVGPSSFVANWQAVPGATSYQLDVSTSPTFETLALTNELFISEYVEGTNNNQYLEIYNGTGATVDLSGYVLSLFEEGSSTATVTQSLNGTLAHGSTQVYRRGTANLPGTAGFAISPVCVFSGNDAIQLFNTNTNTVVDIFGRIGENPGSQWSAGISTLNQTLRRKPTVSSGVVLNPASGFPTLVSEWDGYSVDDVSNLGTHTYTATEPFFVEGYENLTVNGLSQLISGLASDTMYYYRVRAVFNDATSINSNVIQVTTFEEIPVTQVVASQCDGTLSELYGRINVNSVPGATMYRYRVARATAPTTYEFFESPYPRFRLNNFTTLEINFGLTYLVAVQTARVYNGNTFWSEFGTECSITTPAASTVVVSSNQCGQTLPTITSRTFFNSVPNANLYRYRVALQSNPTIFEEIETMFTSFRLNNLTIVPLTSETNYLVSIQARIIIEGNEVWTEYGTPCVITTPDFPTTSIQVAQCGDEDGAYAVSSLTEKLFCDFLSGASYRFKIEKYDNNVLIYSQTVTNPINWITLSSFTGLQPGETYNISVAYNYYGEGPFDKVCTLMVPALNLKPSDAFENSVSNLTTEFKATAYPNPFRNSFALNVTTTSQTAVQLAVFDMTGRILDTRTVAVSALESLAIGENYPAGVYNVVISQDDQLQTIRVIKQ